MNRKDKIAKIAELDSGILALLDEVLKEDDDLRITKIREEITREQFKRDALIITPADED